MRRKLSFFGGKSIRAYFRGKSWTFHSTFSYVGKSKSIIHPINLILSVSVFAAVKQEVVEAAEEKMLIRFGTIVSLTNPLYMSLNKFADLIRAEFGDKLKIKYIPAVKLMLKKK